MPLLQSKLRCDSKPMLRVSPLSGSVPAYGSTTLTVTYQPHGPCSTHGWGAQMRQPEAIEQSYEGLLLVRLLVPCTLIVQAWQKGQAISCIAFPSAAALDELVPMRCCHRSLDCLLTASHFLPASSPSTGPRWGCWENAQVALARPRHCSATGGGTKALALWSAAHL